MTADLEAQFDRLADRLGRWQSDMGCFRAMLP